MNISTKKPATLRLGTFNVHNLMDGVNDPLTRDGSRPKSQKSVTAVARILKDSEADIVSLQEVENLKTLNVLRSSHGLKEQFPYVLLVEGNDRRGIDVAILSRYPITSYETHKDDVVGWTDDEAQFFCRDLLGATVELPNAETLRVFSNHFVRPGENFRSKRLMEARAAKVIVEKSTYDYPTDHFVVMGDFNDVEGSDVLGVFELDEDYKNLTCGYSNSWGVNWKSDFEPARLDHIIANRRLAERQTGGGTLDHPAGPSASDHRMVYVDVAMDSFDGTR